MVISIYRMYYIIIKFSSKKCVNEIVRNQRANFDRNFEKNHPFKIPLAFKFNREIIKLKVDNEEMNKRKDFKATVK